MPDSRQHRGPHPRDRELFGESWLPALRDATFELSWLLTRRYADRSALHLVGNRHQLRTRQRLAVNRSACADEALQARASKRCAAERLSEVTAHVDGFNVLIALEAALSGGALFVGRDGVYRDLSSVHGSYRGVRETPRALHCAVDQLCRLGVTRACWYFDAPVSNSGWLAGQLRRVLEERRLAWGVRVVPDPDHRLVQHDGLCVSGDSWVLEHGEGWFDLVGWVVAQGAVGEPWVLDLRQTGG